MIIVLFHLKYYGKWQGYVKTILTDNSDSFVKNGRMPTRLNRIPMPRCFTTNGPGKMLFLHGKIWHTHAERNGKPVVSGEGQ